MSKSIFTIDTPSCCGECPMSGTGVCRKWSMKEARAFPRDCPLKPAYDVDKVVKRLKELSKAEQSRAAEYCEVGKIDMMDIHDEKAEAYKNSMKIVKSGGME